MSLWGCPNCKQIVHCTSGSFCPNCGYCDCEWLDMRNLRSKKPKENGSIVYIKGTIIGVRLSPENKKYYDVSFEQEDPYRTTRREHYNINYPQSCVKNLGCELYTPCYIKGMIQDPNPPYSDYRNVFICECSDGEKRYELFKEEELLSEDEANGRVSPVMG